MRVRYPLLALSLACLPLLGCDAFGDVERPGESTGGAGNEGGAGHASAGSGAGANKTSSATGLVTVGAGAAGSCTFGDQRTDCASCVEQLCCPAVGPAQQMEPAATETLAGCLDGIGCACANDLNMCFSDYEEDVAVTSSAAFALSGCIRAACAQQCDCCLDH